ncbi:uncharacterized protein YpbB [Ureibacillus xyleni]|uniref:Uncharacterized protein YpbB n=1 Tax=Ureibacillus xyleni TaxID=614648 RepID=A0A285RJF3_9BACL|nr:helix-turn-helix domain-containing protein [Ureibacillus xyleni]SOB94255.1 uncharacterized protein YpbB [Ureibacillus xyleni]
MIFQQILLQIFHILKEERTISAPFHLLRGKRSGQTIQDVGIFHLHHYFGVLPKLSRKKYDEEIHNLVEQQFITIFDNGDYTLTKYLLNDNILPFDGWHYRGNEHVFFARLSLIVQSLSHKEAGQMAFIPIQKDPQIQNWVRNFLISNEYQDGTLQQQLLHEILTSLEQAEVNENAKEILIKRLAGYKIPGYTWQQLSIYENKDEMDIQLLYISCLHIWLNIITANESEFPLLHKIAEQIRITIPLSGSAFQTAQLFKQGYTLEQISHYRRLKMSTIEDHIVELAMNDPQFTINQFVAKEAIDQVVNAVNDYDTRKLKVLREILPHLSYFQIRLVLARGNTHAT